VSLSLEPTFSESSRFSILAIPEGDGPWWETAVHAWVLSPNIDAFALLCWSPAFDSLALPIINALCPPIIIFRKHSVNPGKFKLHWDVILFFSAHVAHVDGSANQKYKYEKSEKTAEENSHPIVTYIIPCGACSMA